MVFLYFIAFLLLRFLKIFLMSQSFVTTPIDTLLPLLCSSLSKNKKNIKNNIFEKSEYVMISHKHLEVQKQMTSLNNS